MISIRIRSSRALLFAGRNRTVRLGVLAFIFGIISSMRALISMLRAMCCECLTTKAQPRRHVAAIGCNAWLGRAELLNPTFRLALEFRQHSRKTAKLQV